MEKTYKVTIREEKFSPFFGFYLSADERTMTLGEIQETLRGISRWIVDSFRWKDYDKSLTHLVYAYQQGDGDGRTYTIYMRGCLLDDKTFYENVADHQGVGQTFERVWAYHKSC